MNNDFSDADSLSENDGVDGLYRTRSGSPNFRTELAAQLAGLVPEAIADGQVDVERLRELLDGDVADTSERFGLFWPGKKQAQRMAQEPTTATLRPDKENSKDWDTTKNVFIEGDNLEVLKILQKHYHNKIKMIYIDPPYNTGKDFVYKDNFRDGIDTYLEWTQQVNEEGTRLSTNSDSEGRYHSNWLNMMYPRLKLARNLLTDDGIVFLSIDDAELRNIWSLCCEIFGEVNSLACLPRRTKTGGGSAANHFAIEHDYVLAFAKSKENLDPIYIPHDDVYAKRYSEEDEKGKYFWDTMERSSTATRPYLITAPDGQKLSGKWFRSEERFHTDLLSGEVRFLDKGDGAWSVQFKQRMAEGKKLRSLMVDKEFRATPKELGVLNLDTIFDFPKPIHLVEHLMKGTTSGDDIVLDFFAGSGTVAHATMDLNSSDGGRRRCISVQLPEPTSEGSAARRAGYESISEISRERIRRSGDLVDDRQKNDDGSPGGGIDSGFRSYNLSDTNFSKWKQSSDVELSLIERKMLDLRNGSSAGDANADDLLTEILLKQGYSLTETIGTDEIAGLDVYLVLDKFGDASVLAYLDEYTKPTFDQLRALVDEKPGRIIILEDAFQGDDELKTNLAQLCKSRDIELWTA